MDRANVVAAALTCGLVVALTGTAFGHGKGHSIGADEHLAIKLRHQLMESTGFAAKAAGMMLKGEALYDAVKAELALRMIQTTAHSMENLFPKASKPGPNSKSEAAPKIWTDMKGFLAEIEKFKSVTSAAVKPAGQGEDAFEAAFTSVAKSCKSCHETYRIKKE